MVLYRQMEENMDWIQTLSIIATVIGTGFYLHCEMASQASRIDAANARIDSLYTMFYDLLKEVKSK